MSEERCLTYAAAIREAIDLCMSADENVFLMGLGVSDPKGIFGTTLGLVEKYGRNRVMDMPVAENGMTGVAIGAALVGMRPIMTHQRLDFALTATDQIINNAAKWHYMFGGASKIPLTIRMIVGRGWGQGPQHEQNLHALFMHVPGLKVVMPFSPSDAKGLLVASVVEDNPVIFVEHRWLHHMIGHVPEGLYRVPIGIPHVVKTGSHVTLVAASYMVLECLKAADVLSKFGVEAEVIDVRTIKPLDDGLIQDSVRKTGQAIIVDSGYMTGGFAAEVAARISEKSFSLLKSPPRRIAVPDCPAPTTRALIKYYHPGFRDIIEQVTDMLDISAKMKEEMLQSFSLGDNQCDVPDKNFNGPF